MRSTRSSLKRALALSTPILAALLMAGWARSEPAHHDMAGSAEHPHGGATEAAMPQKKEADTGHHEDAHKDAHDDATIRHRFDDPERWAKVFDDPERAAWQKPTELIAELKIPLGSAVADIGAGTGFFNPYLAQAVGAEGKVIAVDIEASLIEHMKARAVREQTPTVEARLGAAADPKLRPHEVDLVLLVDTYHHIDARQTYFAALRAAIRPGGRLVVVDFKPGDLPVGPPPKHRIAEAKVAAELTAAGWERLPFPDLLPHQFVAVFQVAAATPSDE